MQDNDPKHTSRLAWEFFADNGVEWWKTPDLNPTKNLWHEHIRREVKPTAKDDLLEGIKNFWGTVNKHKYQKYIGHFKKVIPKVIEYQGDASGY